jgi:hypothetical protein
MEEKALSHLEFWTQFRKYLDDQKIGVRLSKPANRSSSDVILRRSYYRLSAWRLLKDNRVGVSVKFNGPGGTARYDLVPQDRRHQIDARLYPLGAIDWQPHTFSLSISMARKPNTWEERNRWLAEAILTTRALFDEIFPPSIPLNLKFDGECIVNSDTGEEYDVRAVVARLPWQAQKGANSKWPDYPPYMPPHEFVVFGKCSYEDWDVLYFVCTKHPASYLGYFRGYQNPMRYLELGDGYRYWPSAQRGVMMLNRCLLNSVEPPRRKDRGARPIKPKEWGAPPWLPQGNGWPASYLKKNPKVAREVGQPVDESAAPRTIKPGSYYS